MLLNQNWGRIREMTGNLKHLDHEIWSQTCARMFEKIINSKHCLKIMGLAKISWYHMGRLWSKISTFHESLTSAMFKTYSSYTWNKETYSHILRFVCIICDNFQKLCEIFTTTSPYHIMAPWQVSWFSNHVCFL